MDLNPCADKRCSLYDTPLRVKRERCFITHLDKKWKIALKKFVHELSVGLTVVQQFNPSLCWQTLLAVAI
jgi:hypothetical protein